MAYSVEEELEAYITRLNKTQKESLLGVIKSFINTEEESRFTPEELALFYERRAQYLRNPEAVYTVEEAHKRIRQSRGHK